MYNIQQKISKIIEKVEDGMHGSAEKMIITAMNIILHFSVSDFPEYIPQTHESCKNVFGLKKPRRSIMNRKWKEDFRNKWLKNNIIEREEYRFSRRASVLWATDEEGDELVDQDKS